MINSIIGDYKNYHCVFMKNNYHSQTSLSSIRYKLSQYIMYKCKTNTDRGDGIALDDDESERNLTFDTRRRSWRWNNAGAAKFLVARSSIIHHWNHDRVSNRGASLIKDSRAPSVCPIEPEGWRARTANSCVHRHEPTRRQSSDPLRNPATKSRGYTYKLNPWIPRPRRTPLFRE